MFPKPTAVILFYSATTSSWDLLDLTSSYLSRYLNLTYDLQRTYYSNRKDKIMK